MKKNKLWAQIASESKIIMERVDALCGKQRKDGKEKTRTGPDHRHGPVLDNKGIGAQAGGGNYRSMAFHCSSAFDLYSGMPPPRPYVTGGAVCI
ncbi:MAG: hypothetical protein HGB26_04695 [Desulfobulbaceae bacterium]|nr:hypothetical protein [Desulfobulbaceae bacterium]